MLDTAATDDPASAPASPYQTATPGTLARSRSFAASTRFQSPASQYSQDFKSPFLAGTSSPAAGVREAIRQRELLDSAAAKDSVPRLHISTSRSTLTHDTAAKSQASTTDYLSAKRISRVPAPTTEAQVAFRRAATCSSTLLPSSATTSVNPLSATSPLFSPQNSSMIGSSANATSLWSRPNNDPDTPLTGQDVTSPPPWSATSLAPGKWRAGSELQRIPSKRGLYTVDTVVSPSEAAVTPSDVADGDETRPDLLSPSSVVPPRLRRNQTNFTEATSIFSGADGQRSQNSLEKITEADTPATAAVELPSSTTVLDPASAATSRPLSHAGPVSSSLAAIRGMFSRSNSSVAPSAGHDSAPEQAAAPDRLLTSSPDKMSIPSSPTKAKDLIKMFENRSATGSPSPMEQSPSLSRTASPRSKLLPAKPVTSTPSSLSNTPKRQPPLTISISRSNLALATTIAAGMDAEKASPVESKLRAQRFETARFRPRRAGLVIVGGEGNDASFGDGDDDGGDENALPVMPVHSRFRSVGAASQHSRSYSNPINLGGNVLASAPMLAHSQSGNLGQRRSSGSASTGDGSQGRKSALRNSVIGFMGVLSGKPANSEGGAGGDRRPSGGGQYLAPGLLGERRKSTDNVSIASAATQGTTASYRRKREEGDLPLNNVTAIQMSGEPASTKPLRAGVLKYFNVHDRNPRWINVKAVLLPSAIAMSWIPSGGGRENVVLDLRACREVHSVPSPDHPSSASDVGAACARRQGLAQINPFQLIFDDGVERLAADSARERVQWVSAVWDVTGGSPRPDSLQDSALANSGHGAYPGQSRFGDASRSPVNRIRPMAGSSPTRQFIPGVGTGVLSPQHPASLRPPSSNNEEAIERIGSIWKSELSSELTSRDVQPSFGEALASVSSGPPPLPPKEPKLPTALNTPSKSTQPASPASGGRPAVSTALPASQSANLSTSPLRSKVRSWQREPQDVSTGFVHNLTPKTPTLVTPAVAVIHSSPASYTDDKSSISEPSADAGSKEAVVMADTGAQSPTSSSPDMDGYESTRSQSSLIDEFGPRTPVSEAVFNWSRLDKEGELVPSDSASQRPARSDTFKSTYYAADSRKSHDKKSDEAKDKSEKPGQPETEATPKAGAAKTPAQILRDLVLAAESASTSDAHGDESPLIRHNRLGTVIEETQSQTQSTRLNASVRSNNRGSKLDEIVARAVGNGSIKSPAAKSILSLASSGSINPQDVAKLVEYIEERDRERDRKIQNKEKAFEDQIRQFQQVISDLQKKGSTVSARRRCSTSSMGGESKMSARSGRDTELAAMQEKLDKVLDLVTNVVAVPALHKRAKSETTALLDTAGDSEDAEMAKIEGVVAKLLRKMHLGEDVAMSPSSQAAFLDEWERMPAELKGNELIKSFNDRAKYGKDGRHEAILADYGRPRSPEMVRGSSAPTATEGYSGSSMDAKIDPRRRLSASLPRRASGVSSIPASFSTSEVDFASASSRIPPRDWSSERGVPSPPPNSEWDAKSLVSRPASRATTHMGLSGRVPAQNVRMLADPDSTLATPRPVMVKKQPSYGSLDMEAEIRRRRAMQQAATGANVPAAQQGGWYTPKVSAAGMDPQESTSSITAEMPNLDKPVPPTPGGRWAVGDIVQTPGKIDATRAILGKTPDGLGLSMSTTTAGGAKFSGPPPTPGVGYVSSAVSATGSTNGELASVLEALKQSELARQTQLQQQTEILRYLNELNAWLERDVVDRSKEWRTLASGVTQLHDELKALKEGRPLSTIGSIETAQAVTAQTSMSEASYGTPVQSPHAPPSLLRPGTTGAVPSVTERGNLSASLYGDDQITVMGDPGKSPRVPHSALSSSPSIASARRKPAGTRRWNQTRSEGDADTSKEADHHPWYLPDDGESKAWKSYKSDSGHPWYLPADGSKPKSGLKSKAKSAAKAAAGALLVRQALSEWERFKSMQRAQGKPEDPLPAEATGDPAVDSKLPLPQPILNELKNAADKEDSHQTTEVVRKAAEAGYGTQAIIELTKHVESKAEEPDSEDEDEAAAVEAHTPAPAHGKEEGNKHAHDGSVIKMATPKPARVVAKEKEKEKEKEAAKAKDAHDKPADKKASHAEEDEADSVSGSGPTTAALALAVEEILKHLLSTKEEAKKKQTEAEAQEAARKAAEAEREKSLLTLKEKEKAELVDLLYQKIAADKAADEAKQKELDPKSAIESLVAAINAQKEVEVKSAAAADAALKQMTSELLKSTSEQNHKLVEAVNAASREMLKANVHAHAEEFKKLLHKEVTGMFEDVGKIREAKRHLEFEIADLWSIKSRHLQTQQGMPVSFNVPGAFPQIMPMAMPVPVAAHLPAHISPMPAQGPPPPAAAPAPAPTAANGVEQLKAQKKAVKAALKQAVADSAPPAAAAPVPAAPAAAKPPTAAAAAPASNQNFLAKRKDVLNPFSINFGPRPPVAK